MRKACFALAILSLAAFFAPLIRAQEKPPENRVAVSTLKVQVTFVETEGEKKVANLPYTFFVQAADSMVHAPWTKVRVGSRVPKEGAGAAYFDVGTNIDARGAVAEAGKFDIALNLERSWVRDDAGTPGATGGAGAGRSSIIQQFKTELTLTMKDGQTIQATQAVDPLSGRVSTIVVTMNVSK